MKHVIAEFTRMGIGEATEVFGLTPRAVRFYEERGLINPARDRLNQRYFDADARIRLAWIAQLRRAGLGLDDIEAVLHALDQGEDPAALAIRRLEKRRLELEGALVRIRDTVATLSKAAGRAGPACAQASADGDMV